MEDNTFESLSIKLCTVLEDIGVTEELIKFRRYVYNLGDVLYTSLHSHINAVKHTFGSQIEGSTTIDMLSDTDHLLYTDTVAAYKDLPDRLPSEFSFLAIKNTMSCPQCYSLQYVRQLSDNIFFPAREGVFEFSTKTINIIGDAYMLDEEGRVLLSNHYDYKAWFQDMPLLYPNDKIEQHGPAQNFNDDVDFVHAIKCPQIPDDCQVLFSRPKPGHWPKQVTTTKAKQCGVFFILPGNIRHIFSYDTERKMVLMNVHYESKIALRQWRLSTNKIELLLMCDLDLVQMKAYILTKMIRKQFLKPIVGDQLSTFHIKTALLFTVEKYPMEIWNTENLVHCVLLCLITLRRFLKRRYCPHYFIASVDLFPGKLKVSQFPPLIKKLTEIINSGLQCMYTLNTDCLGERLKSFHATPTIALKSREDYWSMTMSELTDFLIRNLNGHFNVITLTTQQFRTLMKQFAQNLEYSISHQKDYSFELQFVYENITNTEATTEASALIADKKPITNDIHEMYKSSLRSGQISYYLKYASMLVCAHDYDRAVTLLKDIESMITQDMVQISMIPNGNILESLSERAQKSLKPNEIFKVFAAKIIMNVEFTKVEINCAPSHLIYEMYRGFTADDDWMRFNQKEIECAVVDAKPFLYYLQYLAHEDTESKCVAKEKLIDYFVSTVDVSLWGFLDTELRLMGHILELENMASEAWTCYGISATLQPRNNAAYWHMCRLLSQYVADK